jgi:hypothetical protein
MLRRRRSGTSIQADSLRVASDLLSARSLAPSQLFLPEHELVLLGLLDVLRLCAPKSPPKSALHIEQAADGMHDDRRSLVHPKGWTGAPEKHARDPYPPRVDARTHLVPQEGEAARWRQQVGA